MEFCDICRNMLYVTSHNDEEGQYLKKTCKFCNNENKIITNEAIKLYETTYSIDDILYQQNINKYIKHDPTLRRIVDSEIEGCEGKSLIYIKYNPHEMNYMYMCEETDEIWKSKK